MNVQYSTPPRSVPGRSRLALMAIASLLLAGCHRESQPADRVELPAVNVTTVKAAASRHALFEELSGVIAPKVRSVLEAKVTGRIVSLSAEPGRAVRTGEPLVKLEAPEIQARADRAQAALKLAGQERQRVQNLFARQAATRAELDAVTAQLTAAEAAMAEATVMLGYLALVAPFDAVISRKLADVGDLATPGKPLLELEQAAGKRFEAAIPELLIDRLKMGTAVSVKLADRDEPVPATVAEIDPAGDPASRSWRVKFDLPEGLNLRSGTFGRVAIPREVRAMIEVPVSAVVLRGQLEQIFVVENGRATLRLVKTGRVSVGRVEILSGLREGEVLVVKPAADLKDGQPVVAP